MLGLVEKKLEKQFFSGNEAIAAGMLRAKLALVTGYPGTPSTEIIESLRNPKFQEDFIGQGRAPSIASVQTHWAANEKVAFEMALGASLSGVRSAVAMKHVGLNAAADPLMTSAYVGVNGGFLIISADDPNMYSSQNEQDNRHYALFAKIPMLEPSDSQEAYLFTQLAFHISERFNTPVLLRTTMRVAHSYSLVDLTKKIDPLLPTAYMYPEKETTKTFNKQDPRSIMLPSIGRAQHRQVEARLRRLTEFSQLFPVNIFFPGKGDTLLVTAGPVYHYIREMFDDLPIYKIGFSHPLPALAIIAIAKAYKHVIVVEELDPFIERELLVCGLPYDKLRKRHPSFYLGELSPDRTKRLILENDEEESPLTPAEAQNATPNPPRLCSGCPHLTIAKLLSELSLTVSGDIGCYTLAALEPFHALHTVIDMGASIPIMLGMQMAKRWRQKSSQAGVSAVLDLEMLRQDHEAPLAVIGDSTFLHSGMPGLLDAGVLSPDAVLCLLDNGTTAMTGQQQHAASPRGDPRGQGRVNYVELAKALGIEQIHLCDPYNFKHARRTLHTALQEKGFSLVIFERACALLKPPPLASSREKKSTTPALPFNNRTISGVNTSVLPSGKAQIFSNCVKCASCLQVGCPSIRFDEKINRPTIDIATCIGCGICLSACEYDALRDASAEPLSDLLKLVH